MIANDKLQKLFDAALQSTEETSADRRKLGWVRHTPPAAPSTEPILMDVPAPAMSDSFRDLLHRGVLRPSAR